MFFLTNPHAAPSPSPTCQLKYLTELRWHHSKEGEWGSKSAPEILAAKCAAGLENPPIWRNYRGFYWLLAALNFSWAARAAPPRRRFAPSARLPWLLAAAALTGSAPSRAGSAGAAGQRDHAGFELRTAEAAARGRGLGTQRSAGLGGQVGGCRAAGWLSLAWPGPGRGECGRVGVRAR